jgi:hypothetical protein
MEEAQAVGAANDEDPASGNERDHPVPDGVARRGRPGRRQGGGRQFRYAALTRPQLVSGAGVETS